MIKALIGAGGFAQDVKGMMSYAALCFVDDEFYRGEPDTYPMSRFDPDKYAVVVTVGDPELRAGIVARLPENTRFYTYIHPSALVQPGVVIGQGAIICANCIVARGTVIGEHCHLNYATVIGHDVRIGDYFTTAPGAKIMGRNHIGDYVYFGTNACTKQNINIVDRVTIGLNGGVVKSITEPGVYVGTPARRMQ